MATVETDIEHLEDGCCKQGKVLRFFLMDPAPGDADTLANTMAIVCEMRVEFDGGRCIDDPWSGRVKDLPDATAQQKAAIVNAAVTAYELIRAVNPLAEDEDEQ